MKGKKSLAIIILLAIAICSFGFQGMALAEKKPIEIKAGHVVPRGFTYDVGLEKFKDIVEKETKGAIKVKIFPQGQLGSERELIEGVMTGTIHMAVVNSAPCTGFIPQIGVFSLPYLFTSDEHAFRTLDGPIGAEILAKFDKIGIKAFSYWDGAKRGLVLPKKAIVKPEDLAGLKVRCMEDPVMLEIFKSVKAIPTPIAWAEVYTALQQGTVDAVETSIPMMALNRFYEVGKHLTFSNHYWTPAPHIVNLKFFAKLPKQYQDIFVKASNVGRDVCRQDVMPGGAHSYDKMLQIMEKNGVAIAKIDMNLWRETFKKTWKKFYPQYGEAYINKIASGK